MSIISVINYNKNFLYDTYVKAYWKLLGEH